MSPFAHQWFAAGNSDFFDSHGDCRPGYEQELFIAEDFTVRQVSDAVGGHAVAAAEVAPVGDREPEVVDAPAEGVSQFHEEISLR